MHLVGGARRGRVAEAPAGRGRHPRRRLRERGAFGHASELRLQLAERRVPDRQLGDQVARRHGAHHFARLDLRGGPHPAERPVDRGVPEVRGRELGTERRLEGLRVLVRCPNPQRLLRTEALPGRAREVVGRHAFRPRAQCGPPIHASFCRFQKVFFSTCGWLCNTVRARPRTNKCNELHFLGVRAKCNALVAGGRGHRRPNAFRVSTLSTFASAVSQLRGLRQCSDRSSHLPPPLAPTQAARSCALLPFPPPARALPARGRSRSTCSLPSRLSRHSAHRREVPCPRRGNGPHHALLGSAARGEPLELRHLRR